MALAGAVVTTAVIWMLSRTRRVMRGGASGLTQFHSVVWAVPTAITHLDPGRGDGGEGERPGHAERKLQEQHDA